jgi:hypothetical protein
MEIWKSIKNYEGIYEASNLGRIKSLKRVVLNNGSYSGSVTKNELILKQHKNKYGYYVVTLQKNKIRTHKSVHRIIAETFIDNINNYNEVNHKNFDKSDNKIENLEWCNRSQNINHYVDSMSKSSKYRGISFDKRRNKWFAYLDYDKKRISLGYHKTEEEANIFRLNFINNLKTQKL